MKVTGEINGDGRYGTIISYHSKSPSMKKMVFGEILPYLYVSTENGIQEYSIEQDPENSDRDWIISYNDDCDIGPNSWIAYGSGETGKTHGLVFSKASGIVQNATNERDGIEVKVAEKEYLDLIGAEVDYASISFGRNALTPRTQAVKGRSAEVSKCTTWYNACTPVSVLPAVTTRTSSQATWDRANSSLSWIAQPHG